MLTDLQIATLLQSQYDGESIFDYADRVDVVSFAVKHYPDCTAVLFEGSFNVEDWLSNFDARMINVPGLGGVEAGFYDGLPETLALVSPMLSKDKMIYVCGHSRGSAHADIFAAMLINMGYRVTIVVFGSPRPGDHHLATVLLGAAARRSYKNRNDPVTCVPEPLLLPYWPYINPNAPILLNQPPSIMDSWGLLADHHFYLYLQGVKEIEDGQIKTGN